jgi:hypothetical protein
MRGGYQSSWKLEKDARSWGQISALHWRFGGKAKIVSLLNPADPRVLDARKGSPAEQVLFPESQPAFVDAFQVITEP